MLWDVAVFNYIQSSTEAKKKCLTSWKWDWRISSGGGNNYRPFYREGNNYKLFYGGGYPLSWILKAI